MAKLFSLIYYPLSRVYPSSCFLIPLLPSLQSIYLSASSLFSGSSDNSPPITYHIKTTIFSPPLISLLTCSFFFPLLLFLFSIFLFLLPGDPSPLADSHRPWCPLSPAHPPFLSSASRSVGSASLLSYTPSECQPPCCREKDRKTEGEGEQQKRVACLMKVWY